MKNEIRRPFAVAGLGFAGITAIAVSAAHYSDFPGFSKDFQQGRTRNSIASVISGIAAQKIYGNSNIDLTVEKTFWPDAPLTGKTTPNSIKTLVDLSLTKAEFTANAGRDGLLEGKVDKSEFDWTVRQVSESRYEIERLLLKWDTSLDLEVVPTGPTTGTIRGKYNREPLTFDWAIDGTYDKENGNVRIHVDIPAGLDIVLSGKITGN